MLPKLLTSIFGSRNDRLLKQYRAVVQKVNALEPTFGALDDAALRAKTDEWRQKVAGGLDLDELLPEAFAAVREALPPTLADVNPKTSVVVAGSLPGKPFPDGTPGPSLYCAVIVKRVDERTRSKTGINELLRD